MTSESYLSMSIKYEVPGTKPRAKSVDFVPKRTQEIDLNFSNFY